MVENEMKINMIIAKKDKLCEGKTTRSFFRMKKSYPLFREKVSLKQKSAYLI